jgi:hypothetical protein
MSVDAVKGRSGAKRDTQKKLIPQNKETSADEIVGGVPIGSR